MWLCVRRFSVAALALFLSYQAGYTKGRSPGLLPPPRWAAKGPVGDELRGLVARGQAIANDDELWWIGTGHLPEFHEGHRRVLRQCLNYEAACRAAWKRHPDTVAHKACLVYARALTNRAYYIELLHEIDELAQRSNSYRLAHQGDPSAKRLELCLDTHGAGVEARAYAVLRAETTLAGRDVLADCEVKYLQALVGDFVRERQ